MKTAVTVLGHTFYNDMTPFIVYLCGYYLNFLSLLQEIELSVACYFNSGNVGWLRQNNVCIPTSYRCRFIGCSNIHFNLDPPGFIEHVSCTLLHSHTVV